MRSHQLSTETAKKDPAMNLKRYEAVVAAIDTASMSGAAKQLGYTPSGIIRLVNALEEELGFPLLARNSTGVSPTPEGKKLLPLFRRMLATDAQVQQTSARIRGLAEGNLTIGALFSVASTWLPHVIAQYQKKYDGVSVNVVSGSDAHLLELLENHAIDCAIMHETRSKVSWTRLGTQELVAWLPHGHTLAKHASLLLVEFDGKPFVRIHTEGQTQAERLMKQRHVEPDIRFTTTNPYTAYSMVRAGLGVSICCNGLAEMWNIPAAGKAKAALNVHTRPLSPQQFIDFGVVTLPTHELSPAVEEFISTASSFADTWPRAKWNKAAQ